MNFLFPDLFDQLDVKDPLLLLSKSIPWEDFAGLYSKKATPAQKEKASERFGKRAEIEPIIGHLTNRAQTRSKLLKRI